MSAAAPRPFPLVPRRRFAGVQSGRSRTSRRGDGDQIAGTRPYQPGDLTAHIHWAASARLSEARGTDEFIVREFFAEQAPRVALVVDRRPAMAIHAPPAPWLDKRRASEVTARLIAASALAERGEIAYHDGSSRSASWLRGHAGSLRALERQERRDYDADDGSFRRALEALVRDNASLPAGSFVFALSDFLLAVPTRLWVRLRSLRWDVTPVIVQDALWEQTFPPIGGVSLPLADPATGAVEDVWLRAVDARERARANEQRLGELLALFRRLGFDPVVVDTTDGVEIAARFQRWADRRRRAWGRYA